MLQAAVSILSKAAVVLAALTIVICQGAAPSRLRNSIIVIVAAIAATLVIAALH